VKLVDFQAKIDFLSYIHHISGTQQHINFFRKETNRLSSYN